MKYVLIVLSLLIFQDDTETMIRRKIVGYFAAKNSHDFNSSAYRDFKRDSSRTWHNEKEGEGILSVFNPNSGWNQWDVAWSGKYKHEIIRVNPKERTAVVRFNENNEFFQALGIEEGLWATVTFWFDENLRVKETLYDWDKDNEGVGVKLDKIAEWALKSDSATILKVYPNNRFIPNSENAVIWRKLISGYKKSNP